ncbi:MAG TPA: tetratricopeptide repeat protein, partial [Candidatus Brocadiia bacterium]|nr:tetratricopeptide repeat protein [Candidatus Brocadiia bacterium]
MTDHIKQGFDLLRAGLASQAEAQFRAALAVEPESPDALYGLGAALRRSGQFEESREWLRRAAAAAPDNPKPWTELGLLCVQSGDLSLAAVSLGRAAAAAPNDAGLVRLLAQVLQRMGRHADADALLEAMTASGAAPPPPAPAPPPQPPGPLPDFSRDAAISLYPGVCLSYEDGCYPEEASPNGPVRWLSARSVIRVVRTAPQPIQDLALRFDLHAPRPATYSGREFNAKVAVNGAAQPAIKLSPNGNASAGIALNAAETSEWVITITCDDEFAPCDCDPALQDPRRLSLMLHAVKLSCPAWPRHTLLCEVCGQPSSAPDKPCPACAAAPLDRAAAQALGLALRLQGPASQWPKDFNIRFLDFWPRAALHGPLSKAFDCAALATPGDGLRLGADSLPCATGRFDAALSAGAAEFLEDDASFFGEIWRVLKPRGVFVVA